MHCRSPLCFTFTLLSYVHLSFQQYGIEPSNADILNAISNLEYRLEEKLEDLLDDRFAKLLEMKLSNLLEKKLASVHERFNIIEDDLLAVRDDLAYIRGSMKRNMSEEFHDKSTDVGTFTQDVTRASLPSHTDQTTSISQSIPTIYPPIQPIPYPTVPPAICSFTRQPSSTTTLSGLTMWKAAKKGVLAFVNKALASGTYVDWQNNNRSNYTALHVAARFNHPAVVKALLDACADKDLQSDGGMTAVYVASLYGNTDVVSISDSLWC
ncbi:unnamed protein product [Meganyctiphanes norvegica]|uniref:Uncharacterized protein n=1 Tax=Meganyctiphanes norvegica TaxID=48144 RepID=A0AAV2RSG2_MEGNR